MPHVMALSTPDFGDGLGRHGHHHHHGGHGGHGGWRRGGGYYYAGPTYYDVGPCGCPNVYTPVIGTDDRVYRNGCVANCYGAGVKGPAQGVAGGLGENLADATDFYMKNFGTVGGTVAIFATSVAVGYAASWLFLKAIGK